MTCEERLRLEHPDAVNECSYGPTHNCPSDFGYLDRPDWCGDKLSSDNCQRCWAREIPDIPEEVIDKFNEIPTVNPISPKELREALATPKIVAKDCSSCIHTEVCMYKEQFAAAQRDVNSVSVDFGNDLPMRLSDISWIREVHLQCKHYHS